MALRLRRVKNAMGSFLGGGCEIACMIGRNKERRLSVRKDVLPCQHLQGRFFPLSAFTRCLLPGLIGCKLLSQIAFAVTAAGGFGAVDAQGPDDIILIGLIIHDQAPFAEGL